MRSVKNINTAKEQECGSRTRKMPFEQETPSRRVYGSCKVSKVQELTANSHCRKPDSGLSMQWQVVLNDVKLSDRQYSPVFVSCGHSWYFYRNFGSRKPLSRLFDCLVLRCRQLLLSLNKEHLQFFIKPLAPLPQCPVSIQYWVANHREPEEDVHRGRVVLHTTRRGPF